MKLYVCWTNKHFGHTHACATAFDALEEAGYEPEVEHARGMALLPDAIFNRSAGRRKVAELSGGSNQVPALILDDGGFVQGSEEIVAWAKANPAGPA